MKSKYMKAIKAGIIGGIIMAAITLFNIILLDVIGGVQFAQEAARWANTTTQHSGAMPSTGHTIIGLLSLALYLLIPVVLLATGALAARYARPHIDNLGEAGMLGALAGVVAALIERPVAAVLNLVTSVALPNTITASQTPYMDFLNNIICCLPLLAAIAAVLGAVGAAGYILLKK